MSGKWIQTVAKISGKIFIDSGAAVALKKRNSLLAVGITRIEGVFQEKDIVSILSEDNIRLAVGVVRENSQNLTKILQTNERKRKTIIHRDYLFLHHS
jgi:glutamate 5-kinase